MRAAVCSCDGRGHTGEQGPASSGRRGTRARSCCAVRRPPRAVGQAGHRRQPGRYRHRRAGPSLAWPTATSRSPPYGTAPPTASTSCSSASRTAPRRPSSPTSSTGCRTWSTSPPTSGLKDPALYPEWYGEPHAALSCSGRFVYGLPEVYRTIAGAAAVAVPGCYPTAASLALGPLVRSGLVDHPPGSWSTPPAACPAPVGRPSPNTTFCTVDEDFTASRPAPPPPHAGDGDGVRHVGAVHPPTWPR